jgi:tetratricopeptide (TPR) repeat protein
VTPPKHAFPAGEQAVTEAGQDTSEESRVSRPVFVSYATADRKQALSLCKALEARGTRCWISCRDVPPGENYQEAIVRALRDSRAMVLVFSEAANNSDEIKKELSLASRYHIAVMALRLEDVEPSDAFAYELSTRQWVDAFEGWDKSIDSLVQRIGQTTDAGPGVSPSHPGPRIGRRGAAGVGRSGMIAAAIALLVLVGGGAWWLLRPTGPAPHSMMVRLTGFSNLSADVPAAMPGAIRDEIIAAFNDDGVVGVSTASAPPQGDAPAYALGGTVRRDGDKIKVNVRLTNERSGTTLWAHMFSYDSDQLPRLPRRIAINAGSMMRCGLFGASTYRKALSDPVLADYLQYCQSATMEWQPGKQLDSARKVVAAAPDFSWGWSGVGNGALGLWLDDTAGPRAAQYRRQAIEAADKAISLDKSNSEALDSKAFLHDARDFVGRESWFKKALDARPLACGCEHHLYGLFLQSVGRNSEASDEFRLSTEVLALDVDSQLSLGDSLLLAGRSDEAKTHFDAAGDLAPAAAPADELTIFQLPVTGDYAAALKAIQNPKVDAPAQARAALKSAYEAMISRDPAAKARAVQLLNALPPNMRGRDTMVLLGALGANDAMMQAVAAGADRYQLTPASWLFYPVSRAVLSDPAFPAFASRLGLMKYWKATHTKPDICSASGVPPFCRMI